MVAKKQQEKENEVQDVVVQEPEPVEYTDPEKVPIHVALARVMADAKAVGKDGFNKNQKYNFRGIDGVMNVVGPALRKHGVITFPVVADVKREYVPAGNGKVQTRTELEYHLNFIGPCGDMLPSPVVLWGEASDYSDKGMAKAHSVAFRTALLQVFCLPTDEPDPDEYSDPVHMQDGPDPAQVEADILAEVQTLNDVEALRKLWSAANAHGALTDAVKDAITARVKEVESSGDTSGESGGGGAQDSGPVEQDS